ncbi:hypothetical protein VKT23_000152 [Stygiomarasmius scandens]|uniref:NAD-dependent epimerase/dehydratase domain-containing protein n=1 Tax=Marasmiellus scandens TaxID=2682957 RepID=A0ABR1K566_9AGAR
MPTTVPVGSKVLVTGANGFIAIWLVQYLLERGYIVRGTVRSEEKAKFLRNLFAGYGERFETVIVSDITEEGAFDDAVKGIDAIEHIASPLHLKVDSEPEELVKPAVRGTVGILEAAAKYGPNVKRIVITSSIASIVRMTSDPIVLSEKDWNEQSVKQVEEQGRSADGATKYRASKTLAERAAWDFYNEHKSQLSWDLVVINPTIAFGPTIQDISNPSALGLSASHWYENIVTGSKVPIDGTGSNKADSEWVDVRDLAEAHVRALQKQEAGGERIIVSAGPFRYQEWMDVVNSFDPSPIPSHPNLPKGNPGLINRVYKVRYDTSKAGRVLGIIAGPDGLDLGLIGEKIRYRTIEECARDTLADFEARGW